METHASSNGARVHRLVGVYDADSTLRGELAYWVGARLGRSHCALCDITHGTFRQRPEWRACRDGLIVPFDTFHRNDQPPEIRAALNGVAPAVAADTTAGVVMVLGPDALAACEASIDRFLDAIEHGLRSVGLRWPD